MLFLNIAKRSAEGYPDLTMANSRLGRHLWVELKREKKGGRKPSLTMAQMEVMDVLAEVHHEVYLWLPRDWLSGAIGTALTARDPLAEADAAATLWAGRRERLVELDIRVVK